MAVTESEKHHTPNKKPAGSSGPASRSPVSGTSGSHLFRYLPVVVIVVGLAAGYAAGLQHYLSLQALADQRDALATFVDAHIVVSAAAFFVAYALAVTFSFPAASVLTIVGGFMFGWLPGGALTAVAATLGAATIFLAARTAFGDVLKKKAGPAIQRLASGFEKDAFSYLLVLRLAPVFPFFVINIVPAFFRISLRDYTLATFIGILPGTFAYAYLGAGLDSVIVSAAKAGHTLSLGDIVTPRITIAFVVLAVVAAIPPVIKKIRAG